MGFCFLFAIFGTTILTYLGISLTALKIGGGLLLFYIALEMLSSRRMERKERSVHTAQHENPADTPMRPGAIYPLAVPLLAGPAALVSVMVVASDKPAGSAE